MYKYNQTHLMYVQRVVALHEVNTNRQKETVWNLELKLFYVGSTVLRLTDM